MLASCTHTKKNKNKKKRKKRKKKRKKEKRKEMETEKRQIIEKKCVYKNHLCNMFCGGFYCRAWQRLI